MYLFHRRARYCKGAVAICTNIKNYFERKIASNGGIVLTVSIPLTMPSHMPVPIPPPIFKNRPRFTRKHRKRETHYLTENDDIEIVLTNTKCKNSTSKRKLHQLSPNKGSCMLYAAQASDNKTKSKNQTAAISAYQALHPSSTPKSSPRTVTMSEYYSQSNTPSK